MGVGPGIRSADVIQEFKFIVKLKKMGGGSGECYPRIEAIVKLKSRGSDSVVGRVDVNDELKIL